MEEILDNISRYSAKELYQFICQRRVTLDDLMDTGELPLSVRREIEDLIARGSDELDWGAACAANTEQAYRDFVAKWPDSQYKDQAWDRIEAMTNPAPQPQVEPEPVIEDPAEVAWRLIDKSDERALIEYLVAFRKSPHRAEAMQRINKLRREGGMYDPPEIRVENILQGPADRIADDLNQALCEGKITEEAIINVFRHKPNIVTPRRAAALENVIFLNRLTEAGIDQRFIDKLAPDCTENSYLDPNVQPLMAIPSGYTEIYFWGVPSSGKTCALGSIMSAMVNGVAGRAGRPDNTSQGARFMSPLASLFHEGEICVLPARNAVEDTFEMRYTIPDDKGMDHNIAFIDMAGELYECMYLMRLGVPLSDKQYQSINVLQNILIQNRSANNKMHFFVIEYGAENNRYLQPNYNVLQRDLLNNMLDYLDQNGILKDNTIGCYVIVTKSDKSTDGNISGYLDQHFYGFCEGLKDLMRKHNINCKHGQPALKRFPFSIGQVCFQKWCLYDSEWTRFIIKEIQDRSYGIETGKIGKFKGSLRQ